MATVNPVSGTVYTWKAGSVIIRAKAQDGSGVVGEATCGYYLYLPVEKTASGTVITGFEYTYDNLSRIIEEKVLANSTKVCYTYDELNRVVSRTIKNANNNAVISTENFTYDYAGNMTDATGHCFAYGSNNKLTAFDGQSVTYDADGNMTFGNNTCCEYDSLNRLTSAGAHDYTYNAENVRIRNLCDTHDTTYTYNTNCKLSQLLEKTTNGITTKYVYGLGLIGEEKQGCFKTYHFDSRGSTIAITNENGNITDTFAYDTYGKLVSRTGNSFVIFGYNGRDGVVTDKNGLIYMRARYYSPDMKRFINADIVAGQITNAVTLNRYAFANANPAMFVDPNGLSAWSWVKDKYNKAKDFVVDTYEDTKDFVEDKYTEAKEWATSTVSDVIDNAKDILTDPDNETERAIGTALDVGITAGAAVAGAVVGVSVGIGTAGMIATASGTSIGGSVAAVIGGVVSGVAAGVATFGAINNSVNAVYYNWISDKESDLTPTSYSEGGGAKYINRWERLDYAKKETKQDYYNLNAWMYYSEYNFHMHIWNTCAFLGVEDVYPISWLAGKAKEASVEPNDPFYDFDNTDGIEKWLRMAAYFSIGILGI